MGINGLLPILKSISNNTHISNYRGKKVAVDAYSWLHKGVYSCSRELCEGAWTDRFVTYFLSRVELLQSNGVIPVIVFDGGRLPIKAEEESHRRRSRQEARDKAAAHLKAGNVAAALDCYQRAVDVSPSMAKQVIECLKEQGVEFVVAPYEADAQMAYLARRGEVHAVITEDSDLLAYGCPRILFKMDKTGTGEEILLDHLTHNRQLSFVGWTGDMFLQLCVLAGCDFLKQLPGIGMKKAHQQLCKLRDFVKVCRSLRFSGTSAPPDYEQRFQMALWAFRHQRVYCAQGQRLVHLNQLPSGGLGAADVDVVTAIPQGEELQALSFLGPDLAPHLATAIAQGEVDPSTHEPFDLKAIFRGCPPGRLPAHLRQELIQARADADVALASQSAPLSGGPTSSRRPPSSHQSGGPKSLPVQGNSIARYFPTAAASSSQAKREFQAPCPLQSAGESGTQRPHLGTQRRPRYGLKAFWRGAGSKQAAGIDKEELGLHSSTAQGQASKRHRPSPAELQQTPPDDEPLADASGSSSKRSPVPQSTADPSMLSSLAPSSSPANDQQSGSLSADEPPALSGAFKGLRAVCGSEVLLGQLDSEFPVSGSDLSLEPASGSFGPSSAAGAVPCWLRNLPGVAAAGELGQQDFPPDEPSQALSGRVHGQALSALASLDAPASGSSFVLSQGLVPPREFQVPAADGVALRTFASPPIAQFPYQLPASSPEDEEEGEEVLSPLRPAAARHRPLRTRRVARALLLDECPQPPPGKQHGQPNMPPADDLLGLAGPSALQVEADIAEGISGNGNKHTDHGTATKHAVRHHAPRPRLHSRFFAAREPPPEPKSHPIELLSDDSKDENADPAAHTGTAARNDASAQRQPQLLVGTQIAAGEPGPTQDGPQQFHSIQHVKAFADVAQAAMQKVELGVLKRFACSSNIALPLQPRAKLARHDARTSVPDARAGGAAVVPTQLAPESYTRNLRRGGGNGKGGRRAGGPSALHKPFVAPRAGMDKGNAKQLLIKEQVANFQRFAFQADR